MSDDRFPPTLGRLPLHRRNDAIARLNRFGAEGRPFVFLVDYAAEQAVVEPLDALSPDELAYDFGGVTNLSAESPQRTAPHASLFDENTPTLTPPPSRPISPLLPTTPAPSPSCKAVCGAATPS